jgi:hypothetical protein
MRAQYDCLRAALRAEGVEIVDVPGSDGDVKAVFTRDMAIAIDGGAIVCRMGPVGVPTALDGAAKKPTSRRFSPTWACQSSATSPEPACSKAARSVS